MCLLAAFVPHRPNKYFHVTASNGIVSNSPYTPLAIMTASPIASVRVFDPRCRCRLATFAALPTPSMIEPIIMLTDHPLLAPHRQVRRCHRSIHCWHGHAARRSAVPRERSGPLGTFRTCRRYIRSAPRLDTATFASTGNRRVLLKRHLSASQRLAKSFRQSVFL